MGSRPSHTHWDHEPQKLAFCRLEVCGTAECNSALRRDVTILQTNSAWATNFVLTGNQTMELLFEEASTTTEALRYGRVKLCVTHLSSQLLLQFWNQ